MKESLGKEGAHENGLNFLGKEKVFCRRMWGRCWLLEIEEVKALTVANYTCVSLK
jgi:hypothetical protein